MDDEPVRGGQGRADREIVKGAALMVAILVMVALAALVMVFVCR